jgi:S1-C subfamily serine protease
VTDGKKPDRPSEPTLVDPPEPSRESDPTLVRPSEPTIERPPGERPSNPAVAEVKDDAETRPIVTEPPSERPPGERPPGERPPGPAVAEVKDDAQTTPVMMHPELAPSPLATTRPDDRPVRDEQGTKPFELPPRSAATPRDGIPTIKPTDASTKPLDLPRRAPAPSEPVAINLVEVNTGVLSVDGDKERAKRAAQDDAEEQAALDKLQPSSPVTVELSEEHSGVLSTTAVSGSLDTSGAITAPGASAAHPLPSFDDTKLDAPAKPLSAVEPGAASAPTAGAGTSTDKSTDKSTAKPPADKPAASAAAASTSTAVDADDIEETVTTTEDTTGQSDDDLVPWVAPDDGFQLADEVGSSPISHVIPKPPVLPSPQEAALEAARIVSRMVDIESESGAVIAAAAAAGAAIEAAVAAQKAGGDPRASQPNLRMPHELVAGVQVPNIDPVTTVRLSRDRILAALASEDIGVSAPPTARESQRMRQSTDPAGSGRIRARTEPGVEEEPYEDFDPVAIAAAAIGRLRQRARTDLAELRVHYQRHDILVLLLALVIIIVAGRVHRGMVTPPTQPFAARGLVFDHPKSWLRPEPIPPVAPRLVRDPTGGARTDGNVYFVELSAVGSTARVEVLIDKKPTWSNIVTGLELDRRSRWGELYTLDASSVRSIAGHDWLRTAYRYAHVAEKGDVPRVDRAVEYATIDREQIYVVTIYGTPLELDQIEQVIEPSLRVPSQTGLPLVPQTGRLSQRKFPGPVGRAFESTVMVVVADLVDGRLKARGGGSGVIVGGDGSILTNYHVIHDKDGRLHDVFVIGRFSAPDKAPQLTCAGRPSRSKLVRDNDLALIKCDMDLDGRTWSPTSSGVWATLPEARAADVKIGQRLWVLGYPDVGGGGLRLDAGEVEGWTGEEGAQRKDFIKTNASITHGNSGGPVIDDQGQLVGIASAFRTRVTASGGLVEMSQIGLVRPLQTASNLLAYAAAGWTPREGYTDVELTPSAVEAAAEGIRIYTTVLDDANEQPVRDATVVVLKAGIRSESIDMNRLDDQAIAWGKTNALGEVRLKQLVPAPGTYTVMVVAPGYEPLIGENELRVDDNTPPSFDPWGRIGLRSR